jgi:hypothetical protein
MDMSAEKTQSTENLALWRRVSRFEPQWAQSNQVSDGFATTSIVPFKIFEKATEEFGNAGIGWKPEILETKIIEGAKHAVDKLGAVASEQIALVRVRITYSLNGKDGVVENQGTAPFVTFSEGRFHTHENAITSATTIATKRALSLLGFGADCYLNTQDTLRDASAAPVQPPTQIPATSPAGEPVQHIDDGQSLADPPQIQQFDFNKSPPLDLSIPQGMSDVELKQFWSDKCKLINEAMLNAERGIVKLTPTDTNVHTVAPKTALEIVKLYYEPLMVLMRRPQMEHGWPSFAAYMSTQLTELSTRIDSSSQKLQ